MGKWVWLIWYLVYHFFVPCIFHFFEVLNDAFGSVFFFFFKNKHRFYLMHITDIDSMYREMQLRFFPNENMENY